MKARRWRVALAAIALMTLLVGARSAFGLFASPAPIASPLPIPAAASTDGHLASAEVQTSRREAPRGFDGVVEAVRQSVVAAQVSGAVTAIDVRVGDEVAAGQVVMRVDARTAEQNATASEAQVHSAQALLDVARNEFVVAEDGQPIIGLGQYAAQPNRLRCEIALVVADAWQGRGVGRRLLDRLLSDAERAGLREAVLETQSDNRVMRALAQKFGFHPYAAPGRFAPDLWPAQPFGCRTERADRKPGSAAASIHSI